MMNSVKLICCALPAFCVLNTSPLLRAEAATGAIKERQEKVLAVVKNSAGSVINISGIGSGVIVSKDGLVLTAGHVAQAVDAKPFKNDAGEFNVTLADGREVRAKALGRNMNRDSALIQITTPGEYPAAEMADEKSIKLGDWCVAMGHPGGYVVDRSAPVRTGRLWLKDDKKCYRTDCTVSGGDSGGPLFDLNGKIIGIHSSIGERLEENRHVPIGAFKEDMDTMKGGKVWGQLGNLMPELAPFDRGNGKNNKEEDQNAVPPRSNKSKGPYEEQKTAPGDSEKKKPAADRPKESKKMEPEAPIEGPKPLLGVVFGNVDGQALVEEVGEKSPAASAGFKPNDVILKIDDKPVKSGMEAKSVIGGHKPGDKLKFSVRRKVNDEVRDDVVIEATLGKR